MQGNFLNVRIFLVIVGIADELLHLLAMKLFRPVTLLAGILSRAKILNRSRNGRMVTSFDNRFYLPKPGEFRLHIPLGTGTDMAGNTTNPGMRRTLIGGIFRVHYRVADCSAEKIGLGEMIGLIDNQGKNRQIDHRQNQNEDNSSSVRLLAEVDYHIAHIDVVFKPFLSTEIPGNGNKKQAENRSGRKDQKGHYCSIGIFDQSR